MSVVFLIVGVLSALISVFCFVRALCEVFAKYQDPTWIGWGIRYGIIAGVIAVANIIGSGVWK